MGDRSFDRLTNAPCRHKMQHNLPSFIASFTREYSYLKKFSWLSNKRVRISHCEVSVIWLINRSSYLRGPFNQISRTVQWFSCARCVLGCTLHWMVNVSRFQWLYHIPPGRPTRGLLRPSHIEYPPKSQGSFGSDHLHLHYRGAT